MTTLTLKNTWKNLTLVAAGALMATMIAVPLAGSASADADDDDFSFHPAPAKVTYSIKSSTGVSTKFELVETDGQMVLVLMEDPALTFIAPDDGDPDEGE